MGYRLGQYTPGSSIIHKLDPRVKIAAVMLMSITVLRADPSIAIAATIFIGGITFIARLYPVHLVRAIKPLLPFFVLIFLMHLFFTPGTPMPLPLATYEGLSRGVLLTWRFVFLILSATILTVTTSPSELISGIERLLRPLRLPGFSSGCPERVARRGEAPSELIPPLLEKERGIKGVRFLDSLSSHDVALMVSMVLRFVPTLLQELDEIKEAQMARGVDFRTGTILARMKRMSSLVIPLIRNSILRAEEVAQGMEARGYHRGHRTYVRELRMTPSDYTILAVLVILTGLGIYWR